MAQATITNFFNKRKRGAEDVVKNSKVLILDEDTPKYARDGNKLQFPIKKKNCEEVKNILYEARTNAPDNGKLVCDRGVVASGKPIRPKGSSRKPLPKSKTKSLKPSSIISKGHADIRLAFKSKDFNDAAGSTRQPTTPNPTEHNASSDLQNAACGTVSESKSEVALGALGELPPKKKIMDEQKECSQSPVSETSSARKELGLMTPKKIAQEKQKDISVNEIKQKLSRSSRLAELRETIRKFGQKEEELKQLQAEREKYNAQSPQLKKFTSIDIVVDVSPRKLAVPSPVKGSPLMSPLKSPLMSPMKSPLMSPSEVPSASPMKLPAYQRLGHLAQSGVPDLSLPYTYRFLAEIFRCTDTVTSMFYNRREIVTFQKLKSAVQEMLRRNFLERHLGQIKRVHPKAYTFRQEKLSAFGSSKTKYELVVTPIIEKLATEVLKTSNGSSYPLMTPSVLVERREEFHKLLLEIVKDHHETFLKTLDPPIVIPRSKITRWHPDFDLERVPPVEADELPQPPQEETYCTAKDVLNRAKDMFSCNQRMERALQKVSEQMKAPSATVTSSSNGNNELSTSALLKGVPKALLEKIRAKQAAKALMAMTRTPDENREVLQMMRLPEITRILWNIFVAEKKNVMKLETIVTKLGNSYRGSLSPEEMEQHIRLVMKQVPGWLELLHVRHCDYLRLSKNCDISAIIKKLESISAEKNKVL